MTTRPKTKPTNLTCTRCGEVLTFEHDIDWGRPGKLETLGLFVPCDTCKKPQRLCEYCWNNTDDCNECEERREHEQWCVLCDTPMVNMTDDEKREHKQDHLNKEQQ